VGEYNGRHPRETVAFYGGCPPEGRGHFRHPGTPIFILPPGFRPGDGAFIRMPVACLGGATTSPCEKGGGSSAIDIVGSSFKIPADEGEVLPPAETTEVWLDGVTFRAGS
jgi:hypothetical protein